MFIELASQPEKGAAHPARFGRHGIEHVIKLTNYQHDAKIQF